MRRTRGWLCAVTVALVTMMMGGPALAMGRLVYLGQDPSCHFNEGGGETQLTTNALAWAGRNADPKIVAVDVDSCDVAGLMASTGFSNVTVVPAGNLPSTNLSGVQALYIAAFFDASSVSGFGSTVQTFTAGGGGLVVEGSQNDWSAYPFGLQVSPSNTYSDSEAVTIIDPTHPVMAGLTNASLSNWGSSIHQDFSSPAAAGFVTLTIDDAGTAVDIVHDSTSGASAPALGGAGMAMLTLLLLGTGFYALRRRGAE